jgi:glycosyltransferase involved in cell wall biosynthesis
MTKVKNTKLKKQRKKLIIVSPFYNEQESLNSFLVELDKILILPDFALWETSILLVNDGSTDNSLNVVKHTVVDIRTKVSIVSLVTNAGHQNALWAGIENSPADSYLIAMDCDLQDPPYLLPKFTQAFDDGYEVILTQRLSRKDYFLKKLSASVYYKILKLLTPSNLATDSGDFFGIDPYAKKRLLSHNESSKYIRGLIQTVSTNTKIIKFHRNSRYSGKTKYTFPKMLKLAIAGVTGFSIKPLILSVYISFLGLIVGIIAGLYLLVSRIQDPSLYPAGYAFSNLVLILLCLFILFIISILSIYMSMVVIEIKRRPNYFIKDDKFSMAKLR